MHKLLHRAKCTFPISTIHNIIFHDYDNRITDGTTDGKNIRDNSDTYSCGLFLLASSNCSSISLALLLFFAPGLRNLHLSVMMNARQYLSGYAVSRPILFARSIATQSLCSGRQRKNRPPTYGRDGIFRIKHLHHSRHREQDKVKEYSHAIVDSIFHVFKVVRDESRSRDDKI